MKPKVSIQIGFYLLSMAAFFVVVAILGTDIPICFDDGAEFIGLLACLTTPGIIIPIICFIALVAIVIFINYLHQRLKGTTLGPIEVSEVKNINNDVMAFVGSYFLPLVSFNVAEEWQHFLVLIILFTLIGLIYIRANIYYTNPTLLALGYRVYKITGVYLGTSCSAVVIVRGELKSGDIIKYIPIDDNTFYARKIDKNE